MIFLSLYFFGQIFGRKFIFFFLLVFFLFLSFLFLVWSSFGFFLLFKMHKSSRGVVSNWAANVPLVSENAIVAPKSTAHLQVFLFFLFFSFLCFHSHLPKEIIKHCAKGGRSVKVLGAGHSSSRIGQTRCGNGVALDMKHFQVCFVLFCFVLFCFVLFCFVLFCFVLFCFVRVGLSSRACFHYLFQRKLFLLL